MKGSRPGLTQIDLGLIAGRIAIGLGAAAVMILLAAGLALLGSRLFYIGRALPGVSAAGIELGGLTKPEIELALGDRLQRLAVELVVPHELPGFALRGRRQRVLDFRCPCGDPGR